MNLVRPALRNPHAVAVAALGVTILGVVVVSRTPTDILPVFKSPAVQVVTFYPGMPAEVVEKDITSRLERWTGQSNGIARQESKSMIGVSVVRDYFRPDIDPNTAMSQVTSLAMSDLFYLPPGTIPPMVVPFDPTASIPLCLITVSSAQFDETALYDIAYFDLRNRLQGIPGVIAPAVYGGKLRRVLAYLDRERLEARGLAPLDVVDSLRRDNVMIPTGNMKIGGLDYQIDLRGMVPHVRELGDFVVRRGDGARPIYLRDVARPEDSAQIQTNVVRITDKDAIDAGREGRRQVYIPVYRQPGANTIAVVDGIKGALGQILARLPQGVRLDVAMDQSVFVRQSIRSLEHEALFGAVLAGVMILVFLRSLRSTAIILVAIPLSVLAAFIGLSLTGDTINAMTLGGLALAIGRLVDDSIVVLENTDRHLRLGKEPLRAARDAAAEVTGPVFAATITTIVVFLPVVFLSGIGRFLFTPLALAVTFSMGASYVVAMTIVPVGCALLLRRHGAGAAPEAPAAEPEPTRLERLYEPIARGAVRRRWLVIPGAAAALAGTLLLTPLVGTELFPATDAGAFTIRVRAGTGTRIERTEELIRRLEAEVVLALPKQDLQMVISNIGVLLDWPAAYTPNSGPHDAFLAVQLTEGRSLSARECARLLRPRLRERFPGVEIFFETGGLITAALNFGLPSPINVQVGGNDYEVARGIAEVVQERVARLPGAEDVRIQQRLDYPQLALEVDRVRASRLGLNTEAAVKNVVTALNSSINFAPSFWIDESNGNHYFIGAQYPEAELQELDTLLDVPISTSRQGRPVRLRNVADWRRTSAPSEVNHLNISRVLDLYADVDGRDVGSFARDVDRIVLDVANEGLVPAGYRVDVRGEVQSMRESFASLGFGLGLATVLVYLVLVAQFRSFLDPFVIMIAVPLGLVGVVLTLLLTGTTLNVQSLLGVIFMVGIAVSNSILIVEFANRLLRDGVPLDEAIARAATVRLRPILMTSLAAILGLLPMAIGVGRGSEANVPLARAVVGGLLSSTVLVLVVIPALYRALRRAQPLEGTRHA